MKFTDLFSKGAAVSQTIPTPHYIDADIFEQRVRDFALRIRAESPTRIHAETATIIDHFMLEDVQDVRDLAELRALTEFFVEVHGQDNLEPYTHHTTQQLIFGQLSRIYERRVMGSNEQNWLDMLAQAALVLHLGELHSNPLQWLIDWKPAEPRIHEVKVDTLAEASLSVLTQLLGFLATREVDLLDHDAVVDEGQGTKTSLWHSITDTRAMREVVEEFWCNQPAVPVDYAEAIRDKTPEQQQKFLALKAREIESLWTKKATEQHKQEQRPSDSIFNLYQ